MSTKIKMKIEIEELDDNKSAVVMSFPNELEFDMIIEILKSGFKEELLYSHIEHKKDCFVISLTTSLEKGKKLSHNIDKMWTNLENRMN